MSIGRLRLLLLPGLLALGVPEGLLAAPKSEVTIPAPKPAVARPGGRAQSYYLYCRAQDAVLNRDYLAARDFLTQAVGADPDSALLWTELARTHLGLQENERAVLAATRAIELDPSFVDPRRIILDLYRTRLRQEDPVTEETFERAVAAHLGLLAVDPADASALVSLGRLYFDRGRFRQVVETLERHVTENPGAIEAAYILSQALARSGDLARSRSVLEGAVREDPENSELRMALAEVMEASGENEEAVAILERLVQAQPHVVAYRFLLARVYQRIGDHAAATREARVLTEALGAARSGSSQESALRAAYMLLIDAAALAGEVQRALGSAVQAERRFPDDTRFPLKRAEIYLVEGRDDDAAAIFEVVRGRPDGLAASTLSMVFLRAGARMEREGDYVRAESLLRGAMERDPGNHAAMNYLGYMLAERGVSLEEALELIERALAQDADNGAYLDSLGWVLFRLGRYTEAEGPLRRAAEIMPEEPVVHDHLGDLAWALGRREDAIGAWREALRLGIEDPDRVREKIDRVGAHAAPDR